MEVPEEKESSNDELEHGNVGTNEPFNPDEWELVEEDECLLELIGLVNRDYLKQCNKNRIKIIGLLEHKMVLQLDQFVFMGEAALNFGTNVIFEGFPVTVDSSEDDDTFRQSSNGRNTDETPKSELKYVTNTRKKVTMYRAFITKKNES